MSLPLPSAYGYTSCATTSYATKESFTIPQICVRYLAATYPHGIPSDVKSPHSADGAAIPQGKRGDKLGKVEVDGVAMKEVGSFRVGPDGEAEEDTSDSRPAICFVRYKTLGGAGGKRKGDQIEFIRSRDHKSFLWMEGMEEGIAEGEEGEEITTPPSKEAHMLSEGYTLTIALTPTLIGGPYAHSRNRPCLAFPCLDLTDAS